MNSLTEKRRRTPAVPADTVESLILTVRGQKVILSANLAQVYGVQTKALNQAVRRNSDRFPADFVFRLTLDEARDLTGLRSQIVTLESGRAKGSEILRSHSVTLGRGRYSKYAPLAFAEHGAVMAATVLNSPRAVQMSVFVVRAFLQLRSLVAGQSELADKLAALERRVTGHDHELKAVIGALRRLVEPPPEPPRRRIGFAGDGA